MALSFVGAAGATATSVTPPTGAVGDLMIVFSYRSGSNTAPSLPAGWTNLDNAGASSEAFRVGYKIATATVDSSGTWTNATEVVLSRFRGQAADPAWIGGHNRTSASTSTITYAAVTLVGTSTAMLVSFCGHLLATAIPTRLGFFRDVAQGSAPITVAEHIASPSGGSETVTPTGTTGAWLEYQLEILPGANNVTGTISASYGALAATLTGKRTVLGTVSQSLGALSASITGKRTVFGTVTGSLGALTSMITGKRTVFGHITGVLGALNATITGKRTVFGVVSGTFGALGSTIAGRRTVLGTVSGAFGRLLGAITGARTTFGSVLGDLGPLSGSAAGLRTVLGSVDADYGLLDADITGTGTAPARYVVRPDIGTVDRPSTGLVTRPDTGTVTRPL